MEIKFSKKYAKIRGVTRAKLLQVLEVKIEHLSLEFLNYDTDGGKFELPIACEIGETRYVFD